MTITEQQGVIDESTGPRSDVAVLAKGAGISITSKIAARVLQLGVQILLARVLGPVGFGLFALGQTVLQVVTQFGTLGLPVGIIRFGVPAQQKDNAHLSEVFRHTFLIAFISGLFFGGSLIGLAPWLAEKIFRQIELTNVVRGFGVATTFCVWLMVAAAATRITRRMQYSALALDLLPYLSTLVLVIALIFFLKLSVLGAVLAAVSGYVVGLAASLLFVRRLFPKTQIRGPLSLKSIQELLSFSIPNSLAGIFDLWLQNVTILILGYFVLPAQVGIFQAAEQVSALSAIVLASFNVIIAPMITDLYEKCEMGRLNELFKVSTKWGLYASLPLLVVIVFFPAQVLRAIYGVSYENGAMVLIVIILGQLVNTTTGSVAPMLSMSGYPNRLLWSTGIAFATCIGLNLWLTPLFGMLGAALSLSGGIVFLNLLLLWNVRRVLGLWPYDRRFHKMLIALLAAALVTFLFSRIWTAASLWQLALITTLSLGIFVVVLLALRLEHYELDLLRQIVRKFI